MSVLISKIEDLPSSVIHKLGYGKGGFFCSYGWYRNFIDTVIEPAGGQSAFLYKSDDLSIFLPVLFTRAGVVRVVKSLANYYSPIYSIFYTNDLSGSGIVSAFFRDLKTILPSWDIMDLGPFDTDEADQLLMHLKQTGFHAQTYFRFGNWLLDVDGRSFAEYFQQLPSQLRNTVTRKSKQFLKMEGARIEIIQHYDDLTHGLEAYNSVYNSSWKVSEPFPNFIPGLMKLALECGGLRLGVAYLEDKAIASQFWIVHNDVAYIYKLAYDENFKNLSIGSILTKHLMEHVIDIDGVCVVDYLCGDDAYKKDWMSRRRERVGLLIFNTSTVIGLFYLLREKLKCAVKRLVAS